MEARPKTVLSGSFSAFGLKGMELRMADVLTVWIDDGPNVEAAAWAARLLMRITGLRHRVEVLYDGAPPGKGPSLYYGKRDSAGGVVIRPCGYFEGNLTDAEDFPVEPSGSIEGVPVLFGAGSATRTDEATIVEGDLIASAFFLASRVEETANSARDEHARFRAADSFLARNGLLTRPLVDEYALFLRSEAKRLWPALEVKRPWGHETSLAIAVTHDIETLAQPRPLGYAKHKLITGFRALLSGHIRSAAANFTAAIVRPITGKNPSWSFARLRRLAEPFPATFFFFGGRTSPNDGEYNVGQRQISEVISDLARECCETGLHVGYDTRGNGDSLAEQKKAIERASGRDVKGGRYHYLRAEFPGSWNDFEKAGLEYDATLGYAEAAGFRAGTSYPFRPFDVEAKREMDVTEVPLVAMDGTFFHYEGLSADETVSQVLTLADTVSCTGGVFTLLWHNTMVDAIDQPEPSLAFARIMNNLTTRRGWGATVLQVVERWKVYTESLEADVD